MTDDKRPTLDHEYDGIREYDNSIPPWFQAMFLGTVLAGCLYFAYYFLGDGADQATEYRRAFAQDEIARIEHALKTPVAALGEAELASLVRDPQRLAEGKAAFQAKCASCHGDAGQGGIGPNLTDEYWLHGGKLVDIQNTIVKGVTEKGMPPWGPSLPRAEIEALTAYIRSLNGTKPQGAKAPEGEKARGT